MNGAAISTKNYTHLLRRQERVERELEVVKKILREATEELSIRPNLLKRWERISRDVDRGKGRVFSSPVEMRKWLRNL